MAAIFNGRTAAVLPLLAIVLLSGCQQKPDRVPVYPAGGTLSHKDKPAVGAIVILHPTNPASAPVKPRGKVGADGTFRLTTYDTGDGAPAGEYAVTVYWPKPPPPGQPNNDDGPDLLDGRCLDPKTPVTHVTISPRDNALDPITIK